jgi:hypothetical protein
MKANMRVVLNKAFNSGAIKQCPPFYRLKVTAFFRFQVAWMYFDERRRWKALKEMIASILLWPIFMNTDSFIEPTLFRVRSLVRFRFVGRIERELEYQRTAP